VNMVFVPTGPFPYQNGSAVDVNGFYIDKYETTNESYCQFLKAADPISEHWDSGMEINRSGDPGSYTYTVQSGREKYPIRYVSFYDANTFAQWKSNVEGVTYRLPTEQEWEKAAAWDPVQQHYYLYGFHRDTIDCTWCNYNSCYCGPLPGGPLPVGSFNGTRGKNDAKSYYGCYDMSGNDWEWTSGIYSGENRVIRGGDWGDEAFKCQSTYRSPLAPSARNYYVGFRLVREPTLNDGLVAYWNFDNDSGNIATDSSGRNNHGTIIGAALTEDRFGNPNKAYIFDGASYIDVPNAPSLNPTDAITVAAWIKVNSFIGPWTPVVTKSDWESVPPFSTIGYALEFNMDNSGILFIIDGPGGGEGAYTDPIAVALNEWTHVVGVYDGVIATLYVNKIAG
jgi:hypothetical protein